MMPHDLFLPESDDADDIEPAFVSVIRLKPFPDTSGGILPADQLPDVATLHAAYGGGVYEVYARDSKRRIIARRKIGPLPGRPKPLALVPHDDDDEPTQRVAPAPAAPATRDQSADLLAFLASQQEAQKQFMAAMLERSERTTALVFQALTETIRAKAEVPAAIAKEVHGPNPMESFLSGVEFARGLMGEQQPQEEPDAIAQTLGLVTEGAKAFAALQSMSGQSQAQPAAPAAAPELAQGTPPKPS